MMGAQLFNTRRAHRWTPALLGASGVAFWIDASQESFNNNDAVGTATDRSGNGLNATQSNGTLKPTFKTGVLNGSSMPAFSFDGGDSLSVPSFTLNNSGILFVCKMTTQGMYFEHGNNGTTDGSFYFYDNGSTYARNNDNAVNAGANWLGTSEAIACGWCASDLHIYVRKNGSAVADIASGGAGATKTAIGFVGARTQSALFITGLIGEMIILASPTADTITKTEGYLAWKWGQQGNLPSTHQWKYARPSR